MTLFKRLRWEYEHGVGTILGVAKKYRVHRRTVRAALKNPQPPKHKRPKMAPLIPFIDAILETDLKASHPHRLTAHQIWTRIRTEIPGVDVSERAVRAYVQTKRAQLGSFQERITQCAATWMMEVLHSDDPLPRLERELRGETALASLARFVKSGKVRERNKALAILGRLKGIGGSVLAQCLQMPRSTIDRYFHRFQCGGVDALFTPPKSKKKEDPECGPFLFSLLHSPPSVYGINRTSWKMEDLHRILAENGHRTSRKRIRILIQEAGFKWRKAKIDTGGEFARSLISGAAPKLELRGISSLWASTGIRHQYQDCTHQP
jgi:transposase